MIAREQSYPSGTGYGPLSGTFHSSRDSESILKERRRNWNLGISDFHHFNIGVESILVTPDFFLSSLYWEVITSKFEFEPKTLIEIVGRPFITMKSATARFTPLRNREFKPVTRSALPTPILKYFGLTDMSKSPKLFGLASSIMWPEKFPSVSAIYVSQPYFFIQLE